MWALRTVIGCRTSTFCSSSSSSLLSYHAISYTITGSTSHAYCLLQYRSVIYNKITKNKLLMEKKRDASYENFMDDEKRMNLLQRIIKLILKQPEKKVLYRYMLRRGGYVGLVKPQKMGDILQKYPRIIRVYRNPNELDVWVTLAKPIIELLEEEKIMKQEMAHIAAERLRKVLMLSTTRRIRLDRIHYLKEELGLPDDFKKSVIRANPQLFKLVISRLDLHKGVSPSVKLLEWDEKLAVPMIEAYRKNPATTSGLSEQEKRKKAYSFPINLPPGFKIKKSFRIKLRKWQELPYRSPYADTSDLDMNSDEALKRAVAVIHEFLHITVEKRTRVDRLAHLRADYKLPQKLGVTVLQNPGIFYMSTKSNVQTIFLREGYKQGKLINKDPLLSFKEKFMVLIKMGRKSIKKPKTGQSEISDSDTSDDEIESIALPEEAHSGKDKEGIEGEGLGTFEGSEEEQEESDLDDHPLDVEKAGGIDKNGDGKGYSDDEDESSVCEDESVYDDSKETNEKGASDDLCDDENELKDDKDTNVEEDDVDEDESDIVFHEDVEHGSKDLFETDDDSEGCSDFEAGQGYGKAGTQSRTVRFVRRQA